MPARANQAGQGLSAPALARQGIPQGVVPTGAPSSEALSEIVAMLRGGQVGAERMMELLSLLAAQTVPQMQQGGPPQQAAGGQASIASLLGG